jgi:AraC-like DNA-binding protein
MPGGATGRFGDPESYVANLRAMTIEFVVAGSGRFDSHIRWAQLSHIGLLCAEESLSRTAYVSLQPPSLFVTFVTDPEAALLLNGVVLQPGEIAFHPSGERFYQRTTGATRWGLLAIAPQFASIHAAALTGGRFQLPKAGRVFRPRSADATRFFRLHARIGRLVEARPASIGHPEVARALEQELIHELMTCFCGSEVRNESVATRRHADVMARLEHQLAAHPDLILPVPELSTIIGTSQRTLLACCSEFLGMRPSQYLRRRRLNRARRSLLDADPSTAKVRVIAENHGFTELGRFAAYYRQVFGETPSMTLRRVRYGTVAGDAPLVKSIESHEPYLDE